MVKFRYVLLDEKDNLIEVFHETQEYSDRWDGQWMKDEHRMLLELNEKYNLYDYDNVPNIEIQIFKDGEWRFYSDPVDDWFNL